MSQEQMRAMAVMLLHQQAFAVAPPPPRVADSPPPAASMVPPQAWYARAWAWLRARYDLVGWSED